MQTKAYSYRDFDSSISHDILIHFHSYSSSDSCSNVSSEPICFLAPFWKGIAFDPQILVAIVSIASLFCLSKSYGYVGIWVALTIYMGLRTFAGFWR